MNTTSVHPAKPQLASANDVVPHALEAGVEAGSELRIGHLAATGFGVGGTIGAIFGAVAVGIAAMSTDIVLPGSSLYVAGPLSAMLLGAGAGAANGGLAGALIGWGIPVELSSNAVGKARQSLRQGVRSVLCPNCK